MALKENGGLLAPLNMAGDWLSFGVRAISLAHGLVHCVFHLRRYRSTGGEGWLIN